MVTRFRAPFQFRSGLRYRLLKDGRGFLDSAARVQGDDIRSPPETTRLVPLFIALALVVPAPGLSARRRSSRHTSLFILDYFRFSHLGVALFLRAIPSLVCSVVS